ncbi:hypothetical protein FNH13_15415 [Ornithinimicrobium ciconiae]|uniref:Uncharacterized protein n=1 Tax=Ornithinimicrobium ciconiae TaxID=2594265 RepID=A0A516GDX6_9MICO|nr:hypothetical protein [Ornithinimicrobium ciconiae]QDO89550.1 hypothetical protein FNH13_15415 [Ornithinimicrobium ciconiae]
MNKKHIVGYGVTAVACLGIGLAGNGGAPATTTPSAETVTVNSTAAAPTPAEATVTVTAPGATETHTVTETAEAETVSETVTETVTADPPAPEASIPGDGTFEVGVDVEPGTYVSEASGSCYWARLSGSDGFDSIIDNNFGSGQMIVTINESDRFFETSGCEPWSLRE